MNTGRLGLLACSLALMGAAGCGSSGDDGAAADGGGGGEAGGTIKIAFSADLSGQLAAYDVPALEGMKFAVKQINASGGPYKVELLSGDNKGDPKLTVTQTQEFLDQGAMLQVVGTGGGRTAATSVISEAGGLALGGLNSYPAYTDEGGENAALLTTPDNVSAAATARYACDTGYKTVFTFGSDDFGYTKNLPTYFTDAFEQMCGGKTVGRAEFDLGQTDYASQLSKLKAVDPQPDAIYSPMFVPDSTAFVKQLRQAGIELPYLGSDANYLQEFVDSAGKAAEGLISTPFAQSVSPDTALSTFRDEYTELMGSTPATPVNEAIGRDQVYGIVEAAKLAKSTEPAALLDKFAELPPSTFAALVEAKWDRATRRPTSAQLSILKTVNGEFEVVDEIIPDYVPEAVR
jgi:branched-chain amino acid transport system substrate-binding protein